ncbi:MAG: carbohydrate-binding domain-containing protein [Lachnospiraceae bacterium]|nr:carbohydrate-binding domain-containing protein [Lachnospiraceae bacterium]
MRSLKRAVLPAILTAVLGLSACGQTAESISASQAPEGVTIAATKAAEPTEAVATPEDPDAAFLLDIISSFPYDTERKEEYTVSEDMTVKFSGFDRMEGFDEEHAIILEFSSSDLNAETKADISAVQREAGIREALSINGKQLSIKRGGCYILRGEMTDGQILVECNEHEKIQLVLDGVSLSCSDSAPLVIHSADKALITLAADSENVLNDAAKYGDESIKGCLYSESDLSINGSGSLSVNAAGGSGINSKDDIHITNGNIYIASDNNGIKGKDSVCIAGGHIMVTAKGDAIKSDKEDSTDKGYVFISGGILNLTADDDCIQAENFVRILDDANILGRCFDKLINCDDVEGEDNIRKWI